MTTCCWSMCAAARSSGSIAASSDPRAIPQHSRVGRVTVRPFAGASVAPDMAGFDPALAALDVEQAPAGLAIADPPDDAGLGAIGDRVFAAPPRAPRADAAGVDFGGAR